MSPWDEGFKRAAWNAGVTFVVTFAFTMLVQFQQLLGDLDLTDGERLRNSAIAGAIAGLSPFVVGGMFARSDQARADKGIAKPYDVPVAILARRENRPPTVVAGDFAPPHMRRAA